MSAGESSNDRLERQPGKRLARQVQELGVPAPFELERFHGWLELHSHRRVRMVPAAMPAGGPSGALIRRRAANYLDYEEQTSAFHQAHIVLCLAAHVVLGEDSATAVDRRLVPDLSLQLVRLILGESRGGVVAAQEAEAFAFLALGRAGSRRLPLAAWRDLRRLAPLSAGLGMTVRGEKGIARYGVWPSIRFRVYQRVIGIRDAMLTLKPYRDERVAAEAKAAAQAAGLADDELTAEIEAAVLEAAVREKAAGVLPPLPGVSAGEPSGLGADLHSETAWLVMVSQAWARRTRHARGRSLCAWDRISRLGGNLGWA